MNYISILEILYPIGSIYLSSQNISPALTIGGSWNRIEDAVIRCTLDEENIATYIGEDEHTLTIEELPSHNHRAYMSFGTTFNFRETFQGGSSSSHNSGLSYAEAMTYVGEDAPHSSVQRSYNIYGWIRVS